MLNRNARIFNYWFSKHDIWSNFDRGMILYIICLLRVEVFKSHIVGQQV